MWHAEYRKYRKSQENKDFISELKQSLNDKNISSDEAKKLQDLYKKIVDNEHKLLAITKEELSDLAVGIDLQKNSSLWKVLKKLQEISKNNSVSVNSVPDVNVSALYPADTPQTSSDHHPEIIHANIPENDSEYTHIPSDHHPEGIQVSEQVDVEAIHEDNNVKTIDDSSASDVDVSALYPADTAQTSSDHHPELVHENTPENDNKQISSDNDTNNIHASDKTINTVDTQKPVDNTSEVIQVSEQVDVEELGKEFWIIESHKIVSLDEKISHFWAENGVTNILSRYLSFIHEKLEWLDKSIIEKIKLSIGIRINSLDEAIQGVHDRMESLWESDTPKKFRWVVNSRIQDVFHEINNKILPSAMLLKNYEGAQNKDDFLSHAGSQIQEEDFFKERGWPFTTFDDAARKDFVAHRIWEIKEMFAAEVDRNDGEFDEFWLNQASQIHTLQLQRSNADVSIFQQIGWDRSDFYDISILSETDKQIEKKATLAFVWAIAAQVFVEVWPAVFGSVVPVAWNVVWGVAWAIAWGTVDAVDMFSRRETLLAILQKSGIVEDEYRMDKTWIDNVLAWIGLIPGMTPLLKWQKIAEIISKFWYWSQDVEKSMKNALEVMQANTDTTKINTEEFHHLNTAELHDLRIELTEKIKNKDISSEEKITFKKKILAIEQQQMLRDRLGNISDTGVDNFIKELWSKIGEEWSEFLKKHNLKIDPESIKNLLDIDALQKLKENITDILLNLKNIPENIRKYLLLIRQKISSKITEFKKLRDSQQQAQKKAA